MATNYKVLGQSAPGAATATTLYTCPASTQTVVSTISVCNRDATASSFRIAIRPDGATLANQHYLCYDTPIAANDTVGLTLGVTMDASDIITVYGTSANISFSAFGSEIT